MSQRDKEITYQVNWVEISRLRKFGVVVRVKRWGTHMEVANHLVCWMFQNISHSMLKEKIQKYLGTPKRCVTLILPIQIEWLGA